jgi:hypothetical protein
MTNHDLSMLLNDLKDLDFQSQDCVEKLLNVDLKTLMEHMVTLKS